jgi:predicted metal-dependent peptidase
MRNIFEEAAGQKYVSGSERQTMERDKKGKRWEDYDTIVCLDGTRINMTKLLQEQAKAKAALIHLEPMFAAFANRLQVVYTFHIKTQATDGFHLFVNPQFTNDLTFEEKVFVMAHECMHCVLDHMRRGRQAGHDHARSNIAADYEVNQTLVDLGLFSAATIQKIKGLIDAKYSGWAYERIYDDNPKGNSTSNNNNSQKGQSDKSQAGGQQGQQADPSKNEGQVTPADCAGQFGSNMPETPGGFMDANEGNELAEKEGYDKGPTDDANSNEWKRIAINQAQKDNRTDAHGARGQFYSKILDLWKTNTDWKKAFRKIIGRALNTQDRRRAFANKNILATQRDPNGRARIAMADFDKFDAVDYMTIFIDSSGSISDDMLRYMLGEVYNIALQLKPETLVLVQLDTKVQECQIFRDANEFRRYAKVATVKGRGGNYQQACWDFLRNDKRFSRTQSELVIMFTDGWLDQHKRDPKTMSNLCWAIIDNPSFRLQYPETRTSVVYLSSKDIKK